MVIDFGLLPVLALVLFVDAQGLEDAYGPTLQTELPDLPFDPLSFAVLLFVDSYGATASPAAS